MLLMSCIRHSSEQYSGIGPWSMIVRCFVGAAAGGCVGVVAPLTAVAESERLTAPLGFTRPVPCTSPPLARMVPFFERVLLPLSLACAFDAVVR